MPTVIRIIGAAALLLVILTPAKSQIGGISASKLSAFNADVVPAASIEFEPLFDISVSSDYWDSDGKLRSLYSDGKKN